MTHTFVKNQQGEIHNHWVEWWGEEHIWWNEGRPEEWVMMKETQEMNEIFHTWTIVASGGMTRVEVSDDSKRGWKLRMKKKKLQPVETEGSK
jgi:hypothetical protein